MIASRDSVHKTHRRILEIPPLILVTRIALGHARLMIIRFSCLADNEEIRLTSGLDGARFLAMHCFDDGWMSW